MEDNDKPPKYQREGTWENKLIAPFAEKINKMHLEQKLIGTRIYNEIKKVGCSGSITTLYRYLQTIKEEDNQKVTSRFETDPAEQGQFDWTTYTY